MLTYNEPPDGQVGKSSPVRGIAAAWAPACFCTPVLSHSQEPSWFLQLLNSEMLD